MYSFIENVLFLQVISSVMKQKKRCRQRFSTVGETLTQINTFNGINTIIQMLSIIIYYYSIMIDCSASEVSADLEGSTPFLGLVFFVFFFFFEGLSASPLWFGQ